MTLCPGCSETNKREQVLTCTHDHRQPIQSQTKQVWRDQPCPIAVFKNLDMADPSRPSVPAVTLLEHHPGYHCLPGLVCYRFRIKIGTSWLCFVRALCQRDQTPLTVLVAILHAKILSHLFHVSAHLLPSISWAPHLAFTNTLANSLTITCQSFPAFS